MLNWHLAENTTLVADFDRTMTYWTPGASSGFGVFPRTPLAPEEFKQEARKLFEYYYPIEIDPNIPEEERIAYMKEWTQKAINLLGNYIDETQFERTINFSARNIEVRRGIKDFFLWVAEKGIPIIVISAWITNIIERVLDFEWIPYDGIQANALGFQDGTLRLVNEGVDIWQKTWNSMPEKIRALASNRTHKILLWDSLDDLHMWDPTKVITSIWFLTQEKIDSWSREIFRRSFDHVIESDVCDLGVLSQIQNRL